MSRLFDTAICITGERANNTRVNLSLNACLMDGSFNAPFSDQATSSTRRNVTFIIRTSEWCSVDQPRVGDVVETAEGAHYAVKGVEPFYSREWILDCRGAS